MNGYNKDETQKTAEMDRLFEAALDERERENAAKEQEIARMEGVTAFLQHLMETLRWVDTLHQQYMDKIKRGGLMDGQ